MNTIPGNLKSIDLRNLLVRMFTVYDAMFKDTSKEHLHLNSVRMLCENKVQFDIEISRMQDDGLIEIEKNGDDFVIKIK